MIFIGPRYGVETVAERWKTQYKRGQERHSGMAGNSKEIWERLAALDPKAATDAEVAAIIGNGSWTGLENCHECGAKKVPVVQLGQPEDYESHTARICQACLEKALRLCDTTEPQR